MVNLASPSTYASGFPHAVFRELREKDPVSWQDNPGSRGYWAVTRYRDVVTVLRDPTTFSSWLGGSLINDPPPEFLARLREGMLNRDPPDHTAFRRLVSKAFTPRRVANLEPAIVDHARALLAPLRDGARFDIASDFAGEIPLYVICEILGVPQADRRTLYRLTARMLSNASLDATAAFEDGMLAARDMRAYSAELMRDKRARPGDDLASDLLAAELDGRRLTDSEFQAFFQLLFNAGADTTRTLLCLGTNLLLDRPELAGSLRADPSRWPIVIEEMLRFESPTIQFRRTATRDVELAGVRIAQNDKVVAFFPSANRDDAAFLDPDRFDPDRTPNEHVAFGTGVHFCLGAPLARLEAKLAFTELFASAPFERVSEMLLAPTAFVRSVKRLEVRRS